MSTLARETSPISVAVVIPTFNHAQFLGDALDSVQAQSRLADEIVVIDDGSSDDPAAVLARYPSVRLISQANLGLAAARNAGLAAIASSHVVFLDADDTLVVDAVARNLAAVSDHPDAGFVYGAYLLVDAERRLLLGPCYDAIGDDPLARLLRGNAVGMHATVIYDTAKLREAGGFDATLRYCEDYDVYLKMAKRFPVASHDAVIASYRMHGANMSADPVRMLKQVLAVHARHRPPDKAKEYLAHWRRGRGHLRRVYADAAIDGRWGTGQGGSVGAILRILPLAPRRILQRALSGFRAV